jgi:cytochrome c oxidase cbb3-type subunit 3
VRFSSVMATAILALAAAARLGAQEPAHPPTDQEGGFDPAAVERGNALLVQQCGFCHGSNARGGQQGPDLTRSELVQGDENGKQLGAFLKVGRPERKMPPFNLKDSEVADLAAFLHSTIQAVSNRGEYKILNIVTGDAKAGKAYFNGAGKCVSCHSVTGDLKGVGAAYDPTTLQERVVLPRGRARGRPDVPAFLDQNAVKATVSFPNGESFTGGLIRLTDFDVSIFDVGSQQARIWLRTDGVPLVTLSDPLQAHVDMLRTWKDADIHNLTAYLVTLK